MASSSRTAATASGHASRSPLQKAYDDIKKILEDDKAILGDEKAMLDLENDSFNASFTKLYRRLKRLEPGINLVDTLVFMGVLLRCIDETIKSGSATAAEASGLVLVDSEEKFREMMRDAFRYTGGLESAEDFVENAAHYAELVKSFLTTYL